MLADVLKIPKFALSWSNNFVQVIEIGVSIFGHSVQDTLKLFHLFKRLYTEDVTILFLGLEDHSNIVELLLDGEESIGFVLGFQGGIALGCPEDVFVLILFRLAKTNTEAKEDYEGNEEDDPSAA